METATTPQYYSMVLQLQKSFMMYIHAHRLTAQIKGLAMEDSFYHSMWASHNEVIDFRFGGLHGTQFHSVDDVTDFSKAFENLLTRKRIDFKHRNPLLYILAFFFQDIEQQSIQKNNANRLKDYADFLSDLYMNGVYHMDKMDKKKEYVKIKDPYTLEYFFAKKHLVQSMELDDLVEYYPYEKDADDIIKYLRINIGDWVMYVPKEMVPSITSSFKLKLSHGETVQSLDFPVQFKYELLKYTVGTMMKEHKNANTSFYKLFQGPEDINGLKSHYKSYKKHKLSNVRALSRIGIIVTDYLIDNKILKTKTDIADFLWEYFSLFKAFELPKNTSLPDQYSELSSFYMQKGITNESIRLMMKEAHQFGDF